MSVDVDCEGLSPHQYRYYPSRVIEGDICWFLGCRQTTIKSIVQSSICLLKVPIFKIFNRNDNMTWRNSSVARL